MSEQTFTPAAVRERHEFPALSKRKPKPKALPGSRPLREPKGLCHLCYHRATRFKGNTPLCLLHYQAVNELLNGGNTSPVTTLIEEGWRAAKEEIGGLRQRLRTRHADLWPDRPIVGWFPASADGKDRR